MLADGSISPRRILSIHVRLSGPSPSLRFRGRDGGVKNGSPVLRTIIASSGISAGGRRLLQHFKINEIFHRTTRTWQTVSKPRRVLPLTTHASSNVFSDCP